MSDTVLVTGGAGYIGSHTVLQLIERGHRVVVLDNLSTGFRQLVSPSAELVVGNISDQSFVQKIIRDQAVSAVIHFAASLDVAESVTNPLKYYWNNVAGTTALLTACAAEKIKTFIFSSTCAVYGTPSRNPVDEQLRVQPQSPYGRTKFMVESAIRDLASADPKFRFIILRYFNVAGAHTRGLIGPLNPSPTHLLGVACQTALGLRTSFPVYGSDYPTEDGTCVRDFIHVDDLADAHILALNYLKGGGDSQTFNCGYGRGFSVLEVLKALEKVTGKNMPVTYETRRPGDITEIYANPTHIKSVLHWTPKFDDLEIICRTAFDWMQRIANK